MKKRTKAAIAAVLSAAAVISTVNLFKKDIDGIIRDYARALAKSDYETHHTGAEEYKTAKDGILRSGALNSCSVVCLYDSKNKIGAMAHFPLYWPTNSWTNTINFEMVLEDMVKKGAEKQNIESMSLRYGGDENKAEYLLAGLRKLEIPNTDIPLYTGAVNTVNFNVKKKKVTIYQNSKGLTYHFR